MSADKNGLVEVYDATQRAYFQGKLIDVDKTSVLVQFDSADGKQPGPVKWFDWTVVREVPPPTTGQTVLEEGQLVEVSYADEGSNEKPAWWEAKILQKKGPYFKVHFLCGSFPDEACEEEKIRPATPSANRGMGPLYTKQTVSLSDTKVHAYFVANEALILSVREKAQLLAIHVDKKSPQLKLIGTAQSIFTGKMLIELHMKHHEEMSRMHSGRELLASKLESEKAKRDTGVRIEFPVEKELIGLVVGKNGKNIAEARRVSGVDVVEVDQHGPKIVVIGPTQESVEKARELLEYVTERVDVRDEQVGWLIGKAGRNFKEMQEKTKITRINVDKGGNGRQPSVIIVGTARSVAAASLYMTTHLEYFEEYQKEEDEEKRLRQEPVARPPSNLVAPAPHKAGAMAKIKKAMKGGSKVVDGKKGPETAQERQLRFEIERMKEEEANRAKEDGRRNELKNRQESEEKYSRINRLKILTQWRKLMRLVKVEDLRKEIEIISQQHEREVDRKDALIQVLDRDLEDSEEQYQMALRAHLLIVDKLIDLHNSRLRGIEFEFERDLQELRDEFGSERYEMDRSHATHKKEMLDILAQMEMDFTEQENDARQEFESTREEIKNRNSEEYNVLRFTLEGLIEELERHFDSAHSNYMSTTEQRTQDFKSLTIRDQQSARTIETQMRKLQRLQDQIAHWKQKLATNGAKCEARNAAMKGERDAIARHFQELKARMNRFREREAARLQELTINSQAAITTLTERKERAEHILKLAELTRKLETEREKVLQFYESSVEEEERAASEAAEVRKSLQSSAAASKDGHPIDEWRYLDNFFKRYNKVLLDVMAIERERNRLATQNGDLRSILKQYLDGISVNEDVINNPNPLLVVNHKTNIVMPSQHRAPVAHTIVEGSHAVMLSQLAQGHQGSTI